MITAKILGGMTGLRGRLFGGFGVVLAIMVILIVSAIVSATRIADANRMNEHTYAVLAKLDAARSALLNMETGQRGFLLSGKDDFLAPYRDGQQSFLTTFDDLKSLAADNALQQQRLGVLASQQADWLKSAVQPLIAMRQSLGADSASSDGLKPILALVAEGRGKNRMDDMRETLASMTTTEKELMATRSQAVAASQQQTQLILELGGAVAVLLGVLMAVLIARSIIKPIARASVVAESIADGRLGNHIVVDRKDELGVLQMAMRRMDDRLCEVVGAVRGGAQSVDSAANELAQGNDDLSQRTQEQASSLEETAASMEQMTSTVKQNAENASHANQLATGVRMQAEDGGKIIVKASEAMREIEASSRQVADIVQLIDEVAFQTNLLALNAAVEAARAGENGRGFAVVATEVRNLAQRSAAAAKDIKSLIGNSVEKVQAGSVLVDESAKALTDIIQGIKSVTDIVAEISAANQEQSSGIEQVNRAVMQMDTVTQQNAALVEEAAAAARAMQEQAASLTQQVSYFQVRDEAVAVAVVVAAPKTVDADLRKLPVSRSGYSKRPVAPPRKALVPAGAAAGDAGVWQEF